MQISNKIEYPGQGCIIEFMEGNAPVVAMVLDEQPGRLRLYTQNKKEVRLASSRVLPWAGPTTSGTLNRSEMEDLLEECRLKRQKFAEEINLLELWELAEGEVEKASAGWFAGLHWDELTIDHEAAMGHALLSLKTHFRFTPPAFEILSKEMMEKRSHEAKILLEREEFNSDGNRFFQELWAVHTGKAKAEKLEQPREKLALRLEEILRKKLADTLEEDNSLWRLLGRGLPNDPNLALHLAIAWGVVPKHYNFHLDRADYESGTSWCKPFLEDQEKMLSAYKQVLDSMKTTAPDKEDEIEESSFISIDPATSKDRDDAFFVEEKEDGSFILKIAFACPALVWPFDSDFDKEVLRRMTSIYLPEGNEHMLPSHVGWKIFSLDQFSKRPGFIVSMNMDAQGQCSELNVKIATVKMLCNLSLEEAQLLLSEKSEDDDNGNIHEPSMGEVFADLDSGSSSYRDEKQEFSDEEKEALKSSLKQKLSEEEEEDDDESLTLLTKLLKSSLKLSKVLQKKRLDAGAIVINRPDTDLSLEEVDGDFLVKLEVAPENCHAHFLVGEIMICANAELSQWALTKNIPLLYRTQDAVLPKEFSGVWDKAHDIARVVRHLPPAILEDEPRRHTALGLSAYATFSSPLRRYVDLFNQGQLVSFIKDGKARMDSEKVKSLIPLLQARRDSVLQIQRYRPRYWTLLFFKQQGDGKWWPAVVTDENDVLVTVSMSWAQLIVRGRRKLFNEKIYPGAKVDVRLGKIDPLLNEINIIDARNAE